MCGICGIFTSRPVEESDKGLIRAMNKAQHHRGPDDEGFFADENCCLGHRRLAIIDLTSDGHQPFISDDGRFILVYNGELYNYIELREELKQRGISFRTRTDTEVLLKAYQQYGKDCLSRFNGMFAFAVYDTRNKSLFLARDRVGVKPLYYVRTGEKFYFASEIKALRCIPQLKLEVNHQAVFDYLVFNRTDVHDETFITSVRRLPKGHYAVVDAGGLTIQPWWQPQNYLRPANAQEQGNIEKISADIERILVSSVELRMRSDVTVGSCLSGGLDSTILVGILSRHFQVDRNYATFSVSFPGHRLDESRYIDGCTARYPVTNFRTQPTGENAGRNLFEFIRTVDEPTTGPSFYAQYELMRLVKEKGVTVLLDGQGGDETFAGYPYLHGFYITGLLRKKRYAQALQELARIIFRQQDRTAYQTLVFQLLSDRQRKHLLLKANPYLHPDFFSAHVDRSLIYNEFFDAPDLNTSLVRHFQYKLEHLLRTEDRNSMAFSIEARLPYLDYRLIEYGLGLAEDLKIKGGETKYLQKKALGKYTVEEILNRTDKIGFAVPPEWLTTEEWTQRTGQACGYCRENFKNIFTGSLSEQPLQTTSEIWKLNQLAAWHQQLI